MEEITKFQQIITSFLQDYASEWSQPHSSVQTQVILDTQNHRYQLVRWGWKTKYDYVHTCIFHLDIIDGKVWIQENRTDILIADELMEVGIPKNKIVLGLLSPEARKDSEFATA